MSIFEKKKQNIIYLAFQSLLLNCIMGLLEQRRNERQVSILQTNCYNEDLVKRKGFKYEKNAANSCPKYNCKTSQTKNQSTNK